ncbi:MAG TPA: tetratricopeptide repeat protein [Planctomycetota bacterium]|nr:tetratricopeptide repeat protein [Planctomycetota bacterium]
MGENRHRFAAVWIVLAVSVALLPGGCGRDAPPTPQTDLYLADTATAATRRYDPETAIRAVLNDYDPGDNTTAVTVDYPLAESVFPPDLCPPTFLWHDADNTSNAWLIDVTFEKTSGHIYVLTSGRRTRRPIDPRCVSATNVWQEDAYAASAKAWTPATETWEVIKRRSVETDARVTIFGLTGTQGASGTREVVSRGGVTLSTSKDPVGAPIFYRDVPLMPTETKEGVIQPIAESALPLIQWRLRYVSEPGAPVIMEHLPTCANCHTFSRDGRTLGMDMDGPGGDKGAHVLKTVSAHMFIERKDVFTWNSYRAGREGLPSFGLFPQVSPDGRYVAATIFEKMYIRNYSDFRFLQTFYPTGGILGIYDRETGEIRPLAGADDPEYVQSNPSWRPDGKEIVFIRAKARGADGEGPAATYANDPNETQIRYDLYRVPFAGGRGGVARPVAGASNNGMSNSFPRFTPDGRWIVYVRCANGTLMRPDGKLYIIPAGGGEPRLMTCNTPLMNSYHSFSPNGRWMVFSSKWHTPFTQMYLTHLDDEGNDTPAILIPNSTAANRAVNLPEFARIPPGGLEDITTPAVDYRRHLDKGTALMEKRRYAQALAEVRKSLELKDDYPDTHFRLAHLLRIEGKPDEALEHYRKTVEINSRYLAAHSNIGMLLSQQGKCEEAIPYFEKELELDPRSHAAHFNWGNALSRLGRFAEAVEQYTKAIELEPGYVKAHNNLGLALSALGRRDEAIDHFRKAVTADPGYYAAHFNWGVVLCEMGKLNEAREHFRAVLAVSPGHAGAHNRLARILVTHPEAEVRSGADAVRHAEIACRSTGYRVPEFLDTLAAAYAEAGRFDAAVRTAEQALAAARRDADTRLAAEIQRHLDLFKKSKPLHGN